MIQERYSMSVNDYAVEIYGELTVREAFDFLNFFDQQGYNIITIGHENSSLRMIKSSVYESVPDTHEILLEDEKKTNSQLRKRLKDQEEIIKQLLTDEQDRLKRLKEENEVYKKIIKLNELENNEEVKQIIEGSQNEEA